MPETVQRNFAPQFVGLGGTGADVLASIFRNRNLIMPLLRTEGIKVSCLALDVADAQIDHLQSVYNGLLGELRERNVPSDRVSLIANSVKFPTPDAMFDFIGQRPDYLSKEGARVPSDYKPWLSSVVEIPPLSGGVGRKRALAKGIYALNYYLLRLIDDAVNTFRENILSSTLQPIIFVVYGLGGGSGSGMALDFTRHLRMQVGSGVPVIGLCVCPCPGDDPPAKGASAYASLLEHSVVLNRDANNLISKKFGKAYDNPFNGFFFVPLSPAFGQGKGLKYAHGAIDDAIGDVLIKCFNFDPADLLATMGTNTDLGENWVHTISTVKISYPVQEYIELIKSYLARLDKMRSLKKEKKEIYGGSDITQTGGVRRILECCRADLKTIYRRWLTRSGKYDPETFEEAVRNLIYEDRSIDSDFAVYLTSAHESMKSEMDELYQSTKAIGMDAAEGTLEARVRKLLTELYDMVNDLPRRYSDLESRVPEIMNSLQDDLTTVQVPPRQTNLLRDVMDLSNLIYEYCNALRAYLEVRKLADKLTRFLEASQRSEEQQTDLSAVRTIANPELVVVYSLLSSMFSPPATELRNMDEHLSNCRKMRRLFSEQQESIERNVDHLREQRQREEYEAERLREDISKAKPLLSSPKKKKALQEELGDVEHRINMIAQEIDEQEENVLAMKERLSEYQNLEKKYEINSDYRRLIPDIINMTNQYYEELNNMSKDRGFYDRTAELTENEQLQIMQRILKGDEGALSRENILREILDYDHLSNYLVSVMGLFKSPNTLGLTKDYRTDLLWFTVVAPPGIWNKDLEQEVATALSGYVERDVAQSIYIREVESDDPWTIRFLLVSAKAKPRQLNYYVDMKQLYNSVSFGERNLAHSYLLEQGFAIEDDDPAKLSFWLDAFEDKAREPGLQQGERSAGD